MLYTIKHGKAEAKIIQNCFSSNLPLPGFIKNAPALQFGLEFYYSAFWDLTTCRSSGWSIGPIPWIAIKEYADHHELDKDMADDLIYFIKSMDSKFIKYYEDKKEKGKKKPIESK